MFEAMGADMFTSMWSSLFGSATALALMGLLPEYVVICTYVYVLRYRVRTCRQHAKALQVEEGELHGGERAGGSRRRILKR